LKRRKGNSKELIGKGEGESKGKMGFWETGGPDSVVRKSFVQDAAF